MRFIIFNKDKENKFIAFHSYQAFLLGLVAGIIYIVMTIISAVVVANIAYNPVGYVYGGGFGATLAVSVVMGLVGLAILIMLILAAIKGYKYEIYELPLFGKMAEKKVFNTN